MLARRTLRYSLVTLLVLIGVGLLYISQATAGYRSLTGDLPAYSNYMLTEDGQYLVFRGEGETLYSIPTQGGIPVRLDTVGVHAVALTPDSRYVVYAERPNGDAYSRIIRIPVQGGVRVPLAEGNNVASPGLSFPSLLTPDGQYVVYFATVSPSGEERHYYSVPITGGIPVQLDVDSLPGTPSFNPRFSPDGRYITYIQNQEDFQDNLLVAVPITGGSHAILNPTGVRPTDDYQFSPDGNRVILEGLVTDQPGPMSYQLYSATLDGSERVPLSEITSGNTPFAITPDSSAVLYANLTDGGSPTATSQLNRVAITGGTAIPLHTIPGFVVTQLKLSPNGAQAAYTLVNAAPTLPDTSLYAVATDGSAPATELATQLGYHFIYSAAFELTNERVIYSPVPSGSGAPVGIYSRLLNGSEAAVTLAEPHRGGWYLSQDGTHVTFSDLTVSPAALYQIAVEGGTSLLLFTAPTSDISLILSPLELPDGKVLFLAFTPASGSTGQVMAADTALSALQFGSAGGLTEEISGSYTTTVTVDAASLTTITAQIEVVGGTATAGEDYTFAPLTITLAPGELSVPIALTLLDDEVGEDDESIILEISNIQGGVAGSPITQTITIAESVYRQWIPFTVHNR